MNPTEIKQARLDAGLTQKELAGAMGVSVKTIEAWEGGWRSMSPSMEKLMEYAIADYERKTGYAFIPPPL